LVEAVHLEVACSNVIERVIGELLAKVVITLGDNFERAERMIFYCCRQYLNDGVVGGYRRME
jgi:hypothetical protein